jgi:hypothetical protein
LFLDAGPYDQRPTYEGRTDGFVVETSPLTEPLTVVGNVTANLWATVSSPDVDWCVTLADAYPDGRRMYVTDGVLRARHRNSFEIEEFLSPDEIYTFVVDLWSTAHTFGVGHRISLIVTNTNSRRFAVNPNNGEPFGASGPPIVADIAVRASLSHPSFIRLPSLTPDLVPVPPVDLASALQVLPTVNPAPRFDLSVAGIGVGGGRAHVIDARGRRVRSYRVSGERPAWDVTWDGRSETGGTVASGVYTFVVRDGRGSIARRKLVLVR